MRILVTGITGFVGGHLAEHLLDRGDEVAGCSRTGRWPNELRHLSDRIELIPCDLTQIVPARSLFDQRQYDAVIHLAGIASPRACAAAPAEAERQNVRATSVLVDAMRPHGQPPRLLLVSSSYVYGTPDPKRLPIGTDSPLQPDTIYGKTKWEAETSVAGDTENTRIDIIRVRPFNHIGPRQPAGYIVADWTRQIAAIERGDAPPVLCVGNLDSRRDYTDVRDVVRAYRLLIEHGRRGEVYNLGSGTSRSGREILGVLSRLSRVPWKFEIDPARTRPNEAYDIVADATPLRVATGWRPEIDFETTLRDTLDYWRSNEKGPE
jgi:GDP-4-dehydro-6-deoxy-D-mannose reductase